jgi:hypothetical protein
MHDEALETIKKIIGEKTGFSPKEITHETFIEDDLNIGEMELTEILVEVDEALKVDLTSRKGAIDTIQDMLDILSEEIE